jgi:hypothetical protein
MVPAGPRLPLILLALMVLPIGASAKGIDVERKVLLANIFENFCAIVKAETEASREKARRVFGDFLEAF